MKSLCLFLIAILAQGLYAQQQIVPDDFTPAQIKLFQKMTESVSAPCCQNAVPVAYHESAMANDIRDQISQYVRDGLSEDRIMASLAEMRMGPQNLPLIFTIPKKDGLGLFAWLSPIILLIVGTGIVLLLFKNRSVPRGPQLSDDELVDRYRSHILSRVGDAK